MVAEIFNTGVKMSKFKKFLALCIACLGVGAFSVFGCGTGNGEGGQTGDQTGSGSESGAGSETGGGTGSGNGGSETGGEQGGETGSENRPETLGEYVKTYIPADYVRNQNFYKYISEMADYDNDASVVSNALYASPNGTGEGKSKADATDLQTAIDEAKAGQTVYLVGGTYNLDDTVWVGKSGSENAYITVRNYPGETPVITASAAAVAKNKEFPVFGLDQNIGYVIFEGLEIGNVKTETAIGIAAYDGGQHNIIIRNNKFHDLETNKPNNEECGANAILLFGEKTSPMDNWLIYGNECYDNVLGWCEAVSVAANCECIYVINNNVHDNTNIGIDFTGNFGYCKDKSLDQPRYCVAAGNVVKNCVAEYAECAGLYVDGARDVLLVNNYLEGSQYGIEVGSEQKSTGYNVKNISVYNNIVVGNIKCGIRVGGYDKKSSGVVENCVIANNTLINNNTQGGEAEFVLSMLDGLTIANNLVKSNHNKMIYTDLSSAETKNITVKNNCFIGGSGIEFEYLGSTYSTLEAFNSALGFNNITGQVELTANYTVMSGVTVDAGDNSYVRVGYDYNFNQRIIGDKVDIGATEKK